LNSAPPHQSKDQEEEPKPPEKGKNVGFQICSAKKKGCTYRTGYLLQDKGLILHGFLIGTLLLGIPYLCQVAHLNILKDFFSEFKENMS